MKYLLTLLTLIACTNSWSQNMDASFSPPGGLTPAESPMFVVIGWDDCGNAGYSKSDAQGTKWILDYTRNLTNPVGTGNPATFDGSPVRNSFFANSMYGEGWNSSEDPVYNKRSWRQAYIDGHEIGNHTRAHLEGADLWTSPQWDTAISKCTDFLIQPWNATETPGDINLKNGIGIAKNELYGFRSPFLVYNQIVFDAVKKNGLQYDCSHEHLLSDAQDSTARTYHWPYTLHNGTQGTPKLNVKIDSLWEIPVYEFEIPASMGGGSVTGFDYNMIADLQWNKQQILDVLKYSLDQRLAGNRAPLTIGSHPDYYTSDYDAALAEINVTATNYKDRQWAIEEFIKYALTKPDVRIVRGIDVINWMKNPEALGQAVTGTFTLTVNANTGGTVTVNPQKTAYTAGEIVTLTAVPDNGKELAYWTGGAVGNASPLTITMNTNKTITATFQDRTTPVACDTTADLMTLNKFTSDKDPKSIMPAAPKVVDSVLTVAWTLAKMSAPNAWDTYAEFMSPTSPSMAGSTSVIFKYKSDKNFLVKLLSSDVTDYAYHSKSISAVSDWTEMNIPIVQFVQPSWKTKTVALKLSSVKNISFQPDVDPTNAAISGTFELKDLEICNLGNTTAIHKLNAEQTLTLFTDNHTLNILSNVSGEYTLNLFSLDGRMVLSENIQLVQGVNQYMIPAGVRQNIYIVQLKSEQQIFTQKLLITNSIINK